MNGKASKCGPCFSSGKNQQTHSISPSKFSMPTHQHLILFFFTISQNCTPTDQTLTILASSVLPSYFLKQMPSLSAASPDWCSRKSTRRISTLFDSLYSQPQRTLPFPNFLKTRRRLSTYKTRMTNASVTRLTQHFIRLTYIPIVLKSILIILKRKVCSTSNTQSIQWTFHNLKSASTSRSTFLVTLMTSEKPAIKCTSADTTVLSRSTCYTSNSTIRGLKTLVDCSKT